MSKKSPSQKIVRLENIVMGMGFLLLKLKHQYGHELGYGMEEQINQALRDFRNVCRAHEQRRRRIEGDGK